MCAFQPELTSGLFYDSLVSIAQRFPLRTVLEIGSARGDGSTTALIKGLANNTNDPKLFAIEAFPPSYELLAKRYAGNTLVHPYNVASVNIKEYPREEDIIEFYQKQPTNLNIGEININNWPLELVLAWFRNEIQFLESSAVPQDGISLIKCEHNIEYFDMVLIDGSEFAGSAELCKIYGARIIALDDINTYKNAYSHRFLLKDKHYEPVIIDRLSRNGFSIFIRTS